MLDVPEILVTGRCEVCRRLRPGQAPVLVGIAWPESGGRARLYLLERRDRIDALRAGREQSQRFRTLVAALEEKQGEDEAKAFPSVESLQVMQQLAGFPSEALKRQPRARWIKLDAPTVRGKNGHVKVQPLELLCPSCGARPRVQPAKLYRQADAVRRSGGDTLYL